jgi:cell division protein FtsB
VNRWPFRERFLPLFVLVTAIVAVPVMILSPTGLPRLRQLSQEKELAAEQIAALEADIVALRERVRRAKEEPAELERIARDELGLLRRTEVVFQFQR